MRTINVSFSLMLRDDPVATAELNEFVLSRVCEQITPHRTSPNLVSDLPTSLHVSSNCYYCSQCAELLLVYQPCSFILCRRLLCVQSSCSSPPPWIWRTAVGSRE